MISVRLNSGRHRGRGTGAREGVVAGGRLVHRSRVAGGSSTTVGSRAVRARARRPVEPGRRRRGVKPRSRSGSGGERRGVVGEEVGTVRVW